MFTKDELYRLKSGIDQYIPTDDREIMTIRSKIYDMIKLIDAWESNQYIQCIPINRED